MPIFRIGSSRPLKWSDLYQTFAADRADVVSEQFEKLWSDQLKASDKPSLLATIWRFFAPKFIGMGLWVNGLDIAIK